MAHIMLYYFWRCNISTSTELGNTELEKRSRSPAAQKFIDILNEETCNSDSGIGNLTR